MRRTETVELTVLCLITDGEKLLLQDRVKSDWQGYTLPGGHVEPGESFVEAVRREVREETGLEIQHPSLVGIKQFPIEGGRYVVLLFRADSFTGHLRSSQEGEMRWVSRQELPALKTVDDLDELLSVFLDPDKTEFQYLVDGDQWTVSIR